ncbi:hypothetical protein [Altericroceibacterium xinjiangense]|uniref:hypothetical protein n=1 Tax=Altericroceibacterium xinjiangense TaxID=762261 RepID=UPI000F7DBF74|nr:hypothetical protein [Altericroceibacterium xinjiangense]
MRNALKPGGTLLVTVPGVAAVERGEWRDTWYWALTEFSAKRMFEKFFSPEDVEIVVYGNVYSASSFLYGLAVEEVKTSWLDKLDPAYSVTIGIRATRAR